MAVKSNVKADKSASSMQTASDANNANCADDQSTHKKLVCAAPYTPFRSVTASNLQQPLTNWLGYAQFSLGNGGC